MYVYVYVCIYIYIHIVGPLQQRWNCTVLAVGGTEDEVHRETLVAKRVSRCAGGEEGEGEGLLPDMSHGHNSF